MLVKNDNPIAVVLPWDKWKKLQDIFQEMSEPLRETHV